MIQDRLVALRRRAGMSQQEVASTIGVSRQTISNWELGQGSPALDKAAELARLYGVTLDDLVSDEVAVVSSGRGTDHRDLHVLSQFVGKTVTLELMDEVIEHATVLGVSETWMRVACTQKKATFGKPHVEQAASIRLIDMADVCTVATEEV